jgi:hypothetical protein
LNCGRTRRAGTHARPELGFEEHAIDLEEDDE